MPRARHLLGDTSPAPAAAAGPRRLCHVGEDSTLEISLQWRSSSTSTSGAWAASTSRASASSRIIRTRLVPCSRCWSRSSSVSLTSPGSCANHIGAYCRNTASIFVPWFPRPSCPRASRSGRYGSPSPKCSTHCPLPIRSACPGGRRASHKSTLRLHPRFTMTKELEGPWAPLEPLLQERLALRPRGAVASGEIT